MIALQNGLVSWAELGGGRWQKQTLPCPRQENKVQGNWFSFSSLQSEDEALQRALELSLAETKPQVPRYLLW